MDRVKFKEIIDKKPLLMDGGMGTEIYSKGFFINRNYESLNLDNPSIIEDIHRSFVEAGANIISTNTFSGNRARLSLHTLEDRLEAINRAGVALVRKTIGENDDILISGSVGSTGRFSGEISLEDEDEIVEIFKEQIAILVDSGVDLISFETFNSIRELGLAIRSAREVSKNIPIMAMVTFPNKNETIFGRSVKDVALDINRMDVDVAGINCSTGPERGLDLLKEFNTYSKHSTIIMPNAGYPKHVDGRVIYLANSELFGNFALKYLENGASIVGGCCGVTPEFIKQMSKSISQKRVITTLRKGGDEGDQSPKGLTPIELQDKSKLSKKIADGEMILSMEVLPPKSGDISKVIKVVDRYKSMFDTVNIPDGPRASARMAIGPISYLIERESSVETIVHYCCRDRNILGIQSDLLGMHAMGLRNILAITGDPPKLGNYPDATAVFDVNSVGLVKILSNLNRGLDIGGNELGMQTSFMIAVGANPAHENIDYEIDLLKEKVEAGAELIMTQPIYDMDKFDQFYDRVKSFNIPIMVGIAPLTSYKSAEFQNNEIPGMEVPKDILQRLKDSTTKEEAIEVGIDLSVETIKYTKDRICGVYFMTQGVVGRRAAKEIIRRSGVGKI